MEKTKKKLKKPAARSAKQGNRSVRKKKTRDLFSPRFTMQEYEALRNKQIEFRVKQFALAKIKIEKERKKILAGFKKRAEAFAKKHRDYRQVLGKSRAFLPPAIEQILLLDKNGPALAYWLAKNPAELLRLGEMPTLMAAKALGRLSVKALRAVGAG